MTPSSAAPVRLATDSPNSPSADRQHEVDLARIERAVREILIAVGEDPKREGLRDTPRRVARAYRDLLSGLGDDPARHLGRVFEHDTAGDDLIIVRGIEFASVCEHHLLPFLGRAHVAYLPDRGKVVGLSKIARAVEVLARRPQLQERLAAQIADAIDHHLGARGVAVMVESEHLCMKIRGVGKQHADMVTTAVRGELARNAQLRAEAHALIHSGR